MEKVSIWHKANNTLEVSAVLLDVLDRFGPPLDQLYITSDLRPLLECAIEMELPMEALWRTLIGNCDDKSCPASPSTAQSLKDCLKLSTAIFHHSNKVDATLQPVEDWSAWSCFDTLRAQQSESHASIPSVDELSQFAEHWRHCISSFANLPKAKKIGQAGFYARAVGRTFPYRRLFVSKEKTLGLAPLPAEAGDQVWLLAGARVPFILRPSGTEGRFRVIGEAYVHGYMHGEFMKEYSDVHMRRILLV